MSRQKDITPLVLIKGLHIKKSPHFYLVYNPQSDKDLVVLGKEGEFFFKNIDGKKTTGQLERLLKKRYPAVTKKDFYALMENLRLNDILESKSKSQQFSKKKPSYLTFWLYLTKKCNFRCTYCFVEKRAKSMSFAALNKAINNICYLAKKNNVSRLNIHFSGGEPLLEMGKITYLAKKLENWCQDHKIQLNMVVLTNGSLVTKKIALVLQSNKIKAAVSLDGIGKYHDKTRHFKGGKPTFNTVIKGINLLKQYNLLTNIEAVVTDNNAENLQELVSYLLKHKISFSLNVFKHHGNSDVSLKKNKKRIIVYLKKTYRSIYDYYDKNHFKGSPLIAYSLLDTVTFFRPHQYGCGAGNSYITLDSNGKIISCPLLVNTSYNIDKGISVDKIKTCHLCSWKYICGGGCPAEKQLLFGRVDLPAVLCDIYKELIPFLLDLEANWIWKQSRL